MIEEVIEYIGANKLVHTSLDDRIRFKSPRPGDPIDLGDGRIGCVDHLFGTDGRCKIVYCEIPNSIYLTEKSVSISGGPFEYATSTSSNRLSMCVG